MIVTVTDVRGSRHYTLSRVVRRFLWMLLVSVLTALSVGTFYILVMHRQISGLEERRSELTIEQARLEYENQVLASRIGARNGQLDAASSRLAALNEQVVQMADDLAHVETLVGLRSEPALALRRRLDTASQTAMEKHLLLSTVPSGYPIPGSRITSGFGMRKDPVRGSRRFHQGIDLYADVGTPVLATADGIVDFAGYDRASGYGNLLVLVHDFGFKTYHGHLDELLVETGEFVAQGQVIALSGKSGRVTGPHLHYEVRRLERKLNPKPFLDWNLAQYDSLFEKEAHVPWDSLARAIRKRVLPTTPLLSQRAPLSTVN
jgi:murein DD-endopeptidase MepM/ murein hydrolase activator NlpD